MSKVIPVIRIIVNSGLNIDPNEKLLETDIKDDMSYSKVSMYKNLEFKMYLIIAPNVP